MLSKGVLNSYYYTGIEQKKLVLEALHREKFGQRQGSGELVFLPQNINHLFQLVRHIPLANDHDSCP